MGNCLVTKLKESVNNDNLKRLGAIRFKTTGTGSANNRFISINCTAAVHVRVTGGTAYNDTSLTDSLGTDFTIPAGTKGFYLSSGDVMIEIDKVYDITKITLGTDAFIYSVDDISYAPTGLIISVYKQATVPFAKGGSINNLANRTDGSIVLAANSTSGINYFRFEGVGGNIENMKKFAFRAGGEYYPSLALGGSDITGDIAVFAELDSDSKASLKIITMNQSNEGKIYGNIEAFKDYTGMRVFDPNYITTTGSLVTAIGHMTDITEIAIGGHTGAEDLANLFDALWTNGKRSGSVVCWMGSNKTLNGSAWVNGRTVTFNNDSSSKWTVS